MAWHHSEDLLQDADTEGLAKVERKECKETSKNGDLCQWLDEYLGCEREANIRAEQS